MPCSGYRTLWEPAENCQRMPRNDAAHLYMAAQVQGRTIERQADGLRQRLCALSAGGDLTEALASIEAMRLQLGLAEKLANELAQAGDGAGRRAG